MMSKTDDGDNDDDWWNLIIMNIHVSSNEVGFGAIKRQLNFNFSQQFVAVSYTRRQLFLFK